MQSATSLLALHHTFQYTASVEPSCFSSRGALSQHMQHPRPALLLSPAQQQPSAGQTTAAAAHAVVLNHQHLPRAVVSSEAYNTANAQLDTPADAATSSLSEVDREVQYWQWQGHGKGKAHRIAYVTHGSGPIPVVLVHGMGACHEHWNKFLTELDTNRYTAYALDLLGFGDSDKPVPSQEAEPRGHLYNFDTWSQQIQDFVEQVVCCPSVLVGNSAGALAALQAAVAKPDMTRGLMLLDCSMRNMHEANQPILMHPLIAGFQWLLLSTPFGRWMVQGVLSRPDALKSILQGAYGDPTCLSPHLLSSWTKHLHDPTSCEVLLDVFTNSTGPLPQDLLPLNTTPTVILWGAADTWEPVQRAKDIFSGWSADFVELPGVGHFPQDEVPALVAAMLDSFVEECAVDIEEGSVSGAGGCRPGPDGQSVEGFSLRGLMAAAEMDAKV